MGQIDQFEEGGQQVLAHPFPALDHWRTDDFFLIMGDRLYGVIVSGG